MGSPAWHASPPCGHRRILRVRRGWVVCVGWLSALACATGGPEAAEDVPVAPIVPEADGSGRIRLSSPQLVADLDVARGRVLAIRLGDQTVLGSSRHAPSGADATAPDWQGRAGIWVWPVPESAWGDLRERGFQPEREMDRVAGTARAWRVRSGAAVLRWTRELGPPLCLRETRTWRVSPFTPVLTLDVELERLRPSSARVGPWVLVRMDNCRRLVWPADDAADSLAEVHAFSRPPAFAWTREPGSVVYRTDLGGVHRFKANDPGRAWIAAESTGRLLLLRQLRSPVATNDPVLQVWAYVGESGRRTELELMDVGHILQPGERRVWSVAVECFPILADLDPRSLALRVRLLAGEKEAASLP